MTHRQLRLHRLPDRGTLLVSTDLHGNLEDLRRLEAIFQATLLEDPDTHWVLLGDLVHGPDARARQWKPALYDYPDDSFALVEAVLEMQRTWPGRVHYVLGNHDYGHIGGPHTRKFYPDEVEHLESSLSPAQRETLHGFFQRALLAVVAPCGVLLTHGSPDDRLSALADLDAIDLPPDPTNGYHQQVIDSLLTHYGQPGEITARLLARLSKQGTPVGLVIHGHDRDEKGWFAEHGNQLCPVIFGAPRENKRYVRLELAARYHGTADLRDGREIRRLYPPR